VATAAATMLQQAPKWAVSDYFSARLGVFFYWTRYIWQ